MRKANQPEWHLRITHPAPRTTIFAYIDANADKMSCEQVFGALESNPAFRGFFFAGLANADVKSFVWETPGVTPRDEFECALTEIPLPRKSKLNPAKYAPHFTDDNVVVVQEGDATLVLPCPKHYEGWYTDLATFQRRVPAAQVHELWQTFATAVLAGMAKGRFWLRSSPPGAQWLHLRIESSSKDFAYSSYAR